MQTKTYTIEALPKFVEPLEFLTGREKRRANRKKQRKNEGKNSRKKC